MADLNDDEPEVRKLLAAAGGRKRMAHPLLLRTGIDIGDDRVLPLWIEIEGEPHIPVQVGDTVDRLKHEPMRLLPPCLFKSRQVCFFENHQLLAFGISQHRLRRQINSGEIVYHIVPC